MVLFFLIGCCFGSFFNLLAQRLMFKQKIIFTRSTCDTCRVRLNWYQLIPIIAFFYYKGHCSICQNKISLSHPIIEILSGCLFILLHSTTLIFNYLAVIMILGAFIHSLSDYHFMEINPKIFYFILLLSGLVFFLTTPTLTYFHLQLLFTCYLYIAFQTLNFFMPQSIGQGDIKLLLSWSSFLPSRQIVVIILSAAAAGIIFFCITNVKGTIPFVPFLTIGLILSFFI